MLIWTKVGIIFVLFVVKTNIMKNSENAPQEEKPLNIEVTQSGLQCDNPGCDWKDENITFDNCADWRNKPCPKCGENVLTDEDYINSETLRLSADFLNSLSQEELTEFAEIAKKQGGIDFAKNTSMFKDAKGLENLENMQDNEAVILTISSHKEIKVKEIKKA